MGGKELSVCHVVNAANESSIPLDIAREMAREDGVEVTFVGMFGVSVPERDDVIDVRDLEASSGRSRLDVVRETRRIFEGHDVVHAHHNHSGVYAKVLGRLSGATVVSTEHNDHRGFSAIGRAANGTTNALAHEVTCVSKAVHESFRRWEAALVPDHKVRIIHNGVPLELLEEVKNDRGVREEYGIDSDSVLVGNAAMLTRQKAQETLIRAIDRANDRGPADLELLVTGDGDRREALEGLVSELELDDVVTFTGFVERRRDVYRTLAATDVFSMPSRWEGFCVAVAEAMALGRPCVLSDIDVFEELYGDVALFHPVDDSDALADRLLELAGDPEKRIRLGEAARNHVRSEYRLATVADEYVDLYRQLVAQR